MNDVQNYVNQELLKIQDLKYKEFHAKLIPTVDKEKIIGVRTPQLRAFARQFAKTEQAVQFIKILPHTYYEENNLHGFIIETLKDYDSVIDALDKFLPYVDNWATCDMMRPKVLKNNLPQLLIKIKQWLNAKNTYTVRFAIEMLMTFYLDGQFKPEYLQLAAQVKSDEYYVNMMIAWYFATALAKQYDAALPYIKNKSLDVFVHNKAIQKAIESYRIPDDKKSYLKQFKIANKGM